MKTINGWKIHKTLQTRREDGRTDIKYVAECPLCGKVTTRSYNGIHDHSSCFCIHSKKTGDLPGTKWNVIKHSALRRKLEFNITPEYVWELFLKQDGKCAISKLPIAFAKTKKGVNGGEDTASLDRIDPKKGYLIGNVQWVHRNINYMKYTLSQKEFIELCKVVASNN